MAALAEERDRGTTFGPNHVGIGSRVPQPERRRAEERAHPTLRRQQQAQPHEPIQQV